MSGASVTQNFPGENGRSGLNVHRSPSRFDNRRPAIVDAVADPLEPAGVARCTTNVSGVTFITGFENTTFSPAIGSATSTALTTGAAGCSGGNVGGNPAATDVSPAPPPVVTVTVKRQVSPLFVHTPAKSQMPAARRAV